jgi:hypothetical protein
MAASPEGTELLHPSHAVARDQVIRILGAARAQGRLTEGEHDERVATVPASTCLADLEALAAAGVIAAIVLSQPDNYLAFVAFLGAAATLIVAPAITVGLMFDVRHQKRSGRQLPL